MEKARCSTHRKSQLIYLAGVILLYILYILWVLGDFYFWWFFLPLFTIPYLVACVILYVPARWAVEAFLNRSNAKRKRRLCLWGLLLPFLTGICFFGYGLLSTHLFGSVPHFVRQQENKLDLYSTLYEQNAERISHISGVLAQSPPSGVHAVTYTVEEGINAYRLDRDRWTHYYPSLGAAGLSEDDIGEITLLMQELSRYCARVTIEPSAVRLIFGNGREVRYLKEAQDTGQLRGTAYCLRPLHNGWSLGIYAWDDFHG